MKQEHFVFLLNACKYFADAAGRGGLRPLDLSQLHLTERRMITLTNSSHPQVLNCCNEEAKTVGKPVNRQVLSSSVCLGLFIQGHPESCYD